MRQRSRSYGGQVFELPIVGVGVVVDRLTAGDAVALAASHSDPDNARLQGWASPLSVEAAGTFIAANEALEPLVPGVGMQLAIRRDLGGGLVGDLFVHRTAAAPDAVEVGITLCPGEHGRGLAAGAIRALVAAVVQAGSTGVARLVAIVDVENAASRRLFARAGFTETEWRDESWVRRDGSIADEVVFTHAIAPRHTG
jgi:RimJ/RimL family protein N-acetyltransferase